jgi:hypothetical protein
MGNLSAFQHHVIDRTLGEATAHGQAGMPGTDNDRGDSANGGRSQSSAAMGLRRLTPLRP